MKRVKCIVSGGVVYGSTRLLYLKLWINLYHCHYSYTNIALCNVLSDHPAVCSSRASGSLVSGVIPVHLCRNYD